MSRQIRLLLAITLLIITAGWGIEPRPAFPYGRETPEPLGFDELYSARSSRGVTISEKLKNCVGKPVRMIGFMAPPLTPTLSFFVLTREPMSICPFCGSDADWPEDIVVVKLKKRVTALPFDRPIAVTGILELGSEIDEETGFVSLVRIASQKLEELE